MRPLLSIASVAILAWFPQTSSAQATIKLKDGSTVTGHGTRYDSEAQTLYFSCDDGRDLVLGIDDLDARSAYLVNRSIAPKDDAERQLALANFARDIELFKHSQRHYRYALDAADASLRPAVERELATLDERMAAYGMEQAEAAAKKGDRKEAEKWYQRIVEVVPDQPQAAEAAKRLRDLTHEADDHLETSSTEALKSDLERGKKYYDSMLEENHDGLLAGTGSKSKRHFEKGIKDGEKALRELDKVGKKRTDAASRTALDGYRELVIEKIIEIHLNIASQDLTHSSFNSALKEVNKALALDNKNQDALKMRSRIEFAANQDDDYPWRRR